MTNAFRFPERHEMSDADRMAWDALCRLVVAGQKSLVERPEAKSVWTSSGGIVGASLVNQTLAGVKGGSALLALAAHGLIDLPEFLIPVANRFFDYLDKLLSKDEDAWKPVQAAVCGNYMLSDEVEIHSKIVQQVLHMSTDDADKVAYLADKHLMSGGEGIKTTIGRYATRQLKLKQGDVDHLTREFVRLTADAETLVKFVENADVDGWKAVYRSNNIASCMNNDDYGVTTYDTYKCYAASAFGLPNNGLRLAWLEHPKFADDPDEAVSRAIVHEPSKTYVRVYGDDTLGAYLTKLGYMKVDSYPSGLMLYAEETDDGCNIHPYLDGCQTYAHLRDDGGIPYWELNPSADIDLSCTAGVYPDREFLCPHCEDYVSESYGEMVTGERLQDVCEDCYDNATLVHYHGDEFTRCNSREVVEATDVDGNEAAFADTERNRNYYEIRWSELADGYIFGDRWVWLEYKDDYANPDEVVELEYKPGQFHQDDVQEFEGLWIHEADMDYLPEIKEWVPEEGLSEALDELREAFIAKCKAAADDSAA